MLVCVCVTVLYPNPSPECSLKQKGHVLCVSVVCVFSFPCVCVCVSGAAEVRPRCCRGAAGEETCPRGRRNSEGRSPAGWRTAGGRRTGSRSRCGSPDARLRYACCLCVRSGRSTASRSGSGCGASPFPAGPERRG